MTDDSPQYCDVYLTVKFSNADKIREIVMPKNEFCELKNIGEI